MKRTVCLGLLAVWVVSFAAVAAVDPCIEIKWENVGDSSKGGKWSMNYGKEHQNRRQDPDNPFQFRIQDRVRLEDGEVTFGDVTVDLLYDEDPFVNGIFAVTNSSASNQIYTFTFTSPVNPPITTSTLYGGSMSGSYTDTGGNQSILVSTVSGTPLYQGKIDGVNIFEIYSAPTAWTALSAGGSGDILAAGDLTDNPGPQALSTLTLEYKFLLSAGDSVTMNGIFEVIPIPEPATLALLGLGSVLFLRKRGQA